MDVAQLVPPWNAYIPDDAWKTKHLPFMAIASFSVRAERQLRGPDELTRARNRIGHSLGDGDVLERPCRAVHDPGTVSGQREGVVKVSENVAGSAGLAVETPSV